MGMAFGAVFAWLVKVQSTFVIISSVQYFQVLTILNRYFVSLAPQMYVSTQTAFPQSRHRLASQPRNYF
jgi:hypothetical protein